MNEGGEKRRAPIEIKHSQESSAKTEQLAKEGELGKKILTFEAEFPQKLDELSVRLTTALEYIESAHAKKKNASSWVFRWNRTLGETIRLINNWHTDLVLTAGINPRQEHETGLRKRIEAHTASLARALNITPDQGRQTILASLKQLDSAIVNRSTLTAFPRRQETPPFDPAS